MSYCRWGDKSDVYLYASVDGSFTCCCCSLSKKVEFRNDDLGIKDEIHDDWKSPNQAEALAHLHEHRAAGHLVLDDAFFRLKKEMAGE